MTSQWAQMVKDSAAEAGITIELQGTERNTYLSMTNEGDYDIYAGNFAIMDDPVTNFALSYLPGGAINYTHVDDPELNALIEEGMVTFDEDDKIEIMRKANKIVHEQVYDNIMYTQNLFFAASDEWSGFISAERTAVDREPALARERAPGRVRNPTRGRSPGCPEHRSFSVAQVEVCSRSGSP